MRINQETEKEIASNRPNSCEKQQKSDRSPPLIFSKKISIAIYYVNIFLPQRSWKNFGSKTIENIPAKNADPTEHAGHQQYTKMTRHHQNESTRHCTQENSKN